MDAQVFEEGAGRTPTWAVNAAPPDQRRIGTIEQREGYFYVVPLPDGPCASMLDGPYGDLEDAMGAIARHLGGKCERGPS